MIGKCYDNVTFLVEIRFFNNWFSTNQFTTKAEKIRLDQYRSLLDECVFLYFKFSMCRLCILQNPPNERILSFFQITVQCYFFRELIAVTALLFRGMHCCSRLHVTGFSIACHLLHTNYYLPPTTYHSVN